jgi:hypothetical protein
MVEFAEHLSQLSLMVKLALEVALVPGQPGRSFCF